MEETLQNAATAAREVNLEIRASAETLTAEGEENVEFTFFCECGCMEPVNLTPAAYASAGAWADGHEALRPSPVT
jgi:hypothetical protein